MPNLLYDSRNKRYAQLLRKNATPEEKRLWYEFLRQYSTRFRRQKQFGNYIVDFYCAKAKLVVELDGSQHFMEHGIAYDEERTRYLEAQGLQVIRFSNMDIKTNFAGVCEYIDRIVMKQTDGC